MITQPPMNNSMAVKPTSYLKVELYGEFDSSGSFMGYDNGYSIVSYRECHIDIRKDQVQTVINENQDVNTSIYQHAYQQNHTHYFFVYMNNGTCWPILGEYEAFLDLLD